MFKAIKIFILIIISIKLIYIKTKQKVSPIQSYVKMNTSNLDKLKEYQHFFDQQNIKLITTKIDLDEVEADPLTVIRHKASQLDEGVIVEDTSLEIDKANIGVNIRWQLNNLDQYLGRQATWKLFLAYRKNDKIYIYKGEIHGKIVKTTNNKEFGFDPYFMPNGTNKTLAQEKPDIYNARAIAVKALVEEKPFTIQPAIYQWEGPWQEHN
jgi:XTP/dITP diphosphohydrolase